MKKTIFLILIILFSCSENENSDEQNNIDCSGDFSTAGILVDINEEIFNDDESVNNYSRYSWSSDGYDRILNGNGIPNHEVGTFPNNNNPNSISEQTGKMQNKLLRIWGATLLQFIQVKKILVT